MTTNTSAWKVGIVTANRFEAQLLSDLIRNAGSPAPCVLVDSASALDKFKYFRADLLLVAIEAAPIDGLGWVRLLRRSTECPCRTAPVFMIASELTLALAENCRHAGANAVIGKPFSAATLTNTIKKVLAKPRPFIDVAGYAGPCRRAGIVTAGAGKRRRKADACAA